MIVPPKALHGQGSASKTKGDPANHLDVCH